MENCTCRYKCTKVREKGLLVTKKTKRAHEAKDRATSVNTVRPISASQFNETSVALGLSNSKKATLRTILTTETGIRVAGRASTKEDYLENSPEVTTVNVILKVSVKDAEKKSVVQLKQSQLSFVQDIPAFFLNVVEGTIFEDHGVVYGPKIIVKISGDKGDDKTQVGFNIVNQKSPNSRDRFFPLVLYIGEDCHYNLDIAMTESGLGKWMEELTGKTVDGRTVDKVLLGGDMSFTHSMLGHSSSVSSFPCYYCEIPLGKMRAGCREHYKRRTFADILEHGTHYAALNVAEGTQQHKKTKSINRILLFMPKRQLQVIEAVIPSGLHILLAAGTRPFIGILRLLACVDLMIERGTDVFPSADFEKFLKKLPYLNGTLVDTFLAEAKKLTIHLSMYFGGSLVGNDCKALFKPGNLASLAVFALDLIAPVAIRAEDRTMIHESISFHRQSGSLFGEAFDLLHAKVPQTLEHYSRVQSKIDETMDHWVASGRNMIPKWHALQQHTVEYLKTLPIRLCDVDEQAVESSHSKVKEVWKAQYCHANNDIVALGLCLRNILYQRLLVLRKP